ncbi:MAG: hypothetical protein ACTSSJ_03235 [Candidatus Odinarchaeia archaeon]
MDASLILLISVITVWIIQIITLPFCNDILSLFVEASILVITVPIAIKVSLEYPWVLGLTIFLPILISLIIGINIYIVVLNG